MCNSSRYLLPFRLSSQLLFLLWFFLLKRQANSCATATISEWTMDCLVFPGHYLGMDVHDSSSIGYDRPLKPGVVSFLPYRWLLWFLKIIGEVQGKQNKLVLILLKTSSRMNSSELSFGNKWDLPYCNILFQQFTISFSQWIIQTFSPWLLNELQYKPTNHAAYDFRAI